MTQSEWLKYRSQVTGKTVEELRLDMATRGRISGKKKTKEEMQAMSKLAVEARRKKKDAQN